MHLLKLLAELADIQPTQLEQSAPRRMALHELGRLGAKTLAAALPLAALPMAAQAGINGTIIDGLNLAVQLERLQEALYGEVLSARVPTSFFPTDPTFRASITTMRSHQQQHITLLSNVITTSGATVPPRPSYDFTGTKNGTRAALFPNVFSDFNEFLKLAQLLEDAGVRAYKGQVDALRTDAFILQTALRIHATEARHATRIRMMRRLRGATVKPWPSPTDDNTTAAGTTAVVYEGENALQQFFPSNRPIPFRLLPIGFPGTNILTQGVPEAFDEPLTTAQATALVALFTY